MALSHCLSKSLKLNAALDVYKNNTVYSTGVLTTATQVPGARARAGHFNQKVRYRHLVDTLSSYTASYANLCHDYYLSQEVEGDPGEKQISEVFHDAKGGIDHPVCQPLCVIILFFRVDGLAAAGRLNLLNNNPRPPQSVAVVTVEDVVSIHTTGGRFHTSPPVKYYTNHQRETFFKHKHPRISNHAITDVQPIHRTCRYRP